MRGSGSKVSRAILLLVALSVPTVLGPIAEPADAQSGQTVVRFVPFKEFEDVLFTNVNGVFDATRDPATGDIWYATGGGIVRVRADSEARRVLGVQDGLPTPLFHDLAFGPDGALWVASDAGLARVDPATEAATYWNPRNDPDAPGFVVSTVLPEDDAVWVGTREKGIARLVPSTGEWAGRWNTSVAKNDGVLSASATADAVYFAARNSGFLRIDRESGALSPLLEPEPYAFHSANAVLADEGGVLWLGTDAGLWKYDPALEPEPYTRYNGTVLSDVRVHDIDRRGEALWVATRTGVSVLNLTTDEWSYVGTGAGLIHNNVRRVEFGGGLGLFATLFGLTTIDMVSGERANYVTGETNGPNSNSLLSGTADGNRVWFSTTDGAASFDPAAQSWLSLGVVDGIGPSSMPVYEVVPDGDRVWFATRKYVWMYNATSGGLTSIQDPADGASNTFFHLDVDGSTLWLPEWGVGLLEYDWKTNATRRYDFTNSGLLDWLVSDAEATPGAVWVATYSGLFKLDKTTRVFTNVYTTRDGFPTPELAHLWLDGRDLWVATVQNGLVRFNTDTGDVRGVYNLTNGGLPGDEVRGVVRDGASLWVAMGPDGLARLDLARGKFDLHYNMTNGMPEQHANGVALLDGVLYVGTHGGLARLHTRTLEWLPMYVEDPEAWLAENPVGTGGGTVAADYPPNVLISDPESGTAVAGTVTVTGRAAKPGGAVDRVEVAVGDGPWEPAVGTTQWSYEWDAGSLPSGDYVLKARAVAGEQVSSEDAVTVAVVPPLEVPLAILHTPPEGAAFSGRDVSLIAEVRGDEPLSLRAFYQPPGADAYKELRFVKNGAFWSADIPAADAAPGDLRYFLEARSGRLAETAPEDRSQPFVLTLRPPPPAAVAVEAPPVVEVKAGSETTFALKVTNAGTQRNAYVVEATGVRSSWVTLDPTAFRLGPGESAERSVTIAAPPNAYADDAALSFTVRPVESAADPATAAVPLRILPADPVVERDVDVQEKEPRRGLFGIPAPTPLVALAFLAAAALALAPAQPRRPGGGPR